MMQLWTRLGLLPLLAASAFAANQEAAQPDPCVLLTSDVLEQVQGSTPVSMHANWHDDGGLTSAQCYYGLSPSYRSVSLQVMTRGPHDRLDVREFWNERFRGEEAENRRSYEIEAQPPREVSGTGDAAMWVSTGRDGALYVLKGGFLLRVGLGGKDGEQDKIDSAVKLAKSALDRLTGTRE